VLLNGLAEGHSFESTQDLQYLVSSRIYFPSLLAGTMLTIVGSFFDRQRLPMPQVRVRGILCLVGAGVSFWLLFWIGNVHSWTFAFIFPTFAGFIAAAILLSKLIE